MRRRCPKPDGKHLQEVPLHGEGDAYPEDFAVQVASVRSLDIGTDRIHEIYGAGLPQICTNWAASRTKMVAAWASDLLSGWHAARIVPSTSCTCASSTPITRVELPRRRKPPTLLICVTVYFFSTSAVDSGSTASALTIASISFIVTPVRNALRSG